MEKLFKEKIEEFKKHEDECVRNVAIEVETLAENFDGMSKEELLEIVENFIAIQEVDNLADTVDRKATAEKAYNAIKSLISSLPTG